MYGVDYSNTERMYGVVNSHTDWGNEDRRESKNSIDESIMASVSFGVLLGLTVVIISLFGNYGVSNEKAHNLVWGSVYSLIFVGTLILLVVCACVYRKIRRQITITSVQFDYAVNIELGFLWTFGIVTFLKNVLALAIDIECWTVTSDILYMFSIISRCAKTIFLCLQIAFISFFKHSKFLNVSGLNFSMYFIILVNFLIWFKEIVRDVQFIDNGPKPLNLTSTILSNYTPPVDGVACFYHSEIQSLYLKLMPYMKPAVFQFCLLSISFILRLHPSLNYKTSFGGILTYIPSDEERRQFSSSNAFRKQCTLMMALVLNVLMSVIFMIANFVHSTDSIFTYIWKGCLLSQKTLILLFIFIQFHSMSHSLHHVITERKIDMNECSLIFLTAGSTAFNAVGIMDIQVKQGFSFIIVLNILDVAILYYQTIQILYANRIQIDSGLSKDVYQLSNIFLFMAVCNLSMWLVYSFIGLHQSCTFEGFLDKISRANHQILFPVVISYHFRSAIDLYCLHHRVRKL